MATSLARLTQLQWVDMPAKPAAVQACTALVGLHTLRLRGHFLTLHPVAVLTQLIRLTLIANPGCSADGVLSPLSSLQLLSLDIRNFLGQTALSIPSLKDLVWAFSRPAVTRPLVDLSGCCRLETLHIVFQSDVMVSAGHLPRSLQRLTYSYRGAGRLWCEADVLVAGVQLHRAEWPSFGRDGR